MPSIGLASCSASTRARTCEPSGRSAGCGRNSCSGGSSSRIVTGRPSIAANRPAKSFSCSGRRRSIAACRASSVSARITSAISGWRSPRNWCSVRHSPMPSAPNSTACRASSGVSALARTPRRRWSSAHARTWRKSSPTTGWMSGMSSVLIAPVEPSMAIRSPPCSTVSAIVTVRPSRSISTADAPVTAGTPMPRATSAACDALPPSLVRIPRAAWNPAMSSPR